MAKQMPKRNLEKVGLSVTGACVALVTLVVVALIFMVAQRGLSTFITTEIIGWSTCGFLHLLKRTLREKGSRTVLSENAIDRRVSWLVYGMVAVILFRIVLTLLFPEDGTSGSRFPAYLSCFLHLRRNGKLTITRTEPTL